MHVKHVVPESPITTDRPADATVLSRDLENGACTRMKPRGEAVA
jgi:hypothetical protein